MRTEVLGRLHVVTGSIEIAEAALSAGAPVIQVRVKGVTDREAVHTASVIRDLCSTVGATCIVNDRADIALAVGADGVHVGADDLPVAAVRAVVGRDMLVGATARDSDTARRHEAEGASYLGVGPAYATGTKSGLPAPLGPEGVARVGEAVDLPVIAIAGVTVERVSELLAAGAHGVAVVSAIADAPDPAIATKELLAALEPA